MLYNTVIFLERSLEDTKRMSTKAEDTQKNILDTARKHFLKDGLTGASLRNIVKDAGLTTGAFYKYYPTKEAHFDALTDPYMINMFHIRIRQCIKKCLFRRVIFVKCASSKPCIFYNIS